VDSRGFFFRAGYERATERGISLGLTMLPGYIEERFLDCVCRHPPQQTRRMEEKRRPTPLGMTPFYFQESERSGEELCGVERRVLRELLHQNTSIAQSRLATFWINPGNRSIRRAFARLEPSNA